MILAHGYKVWALPLSLPIYKFAIYTIDFGSTLGFNIH